MKSAAYWRTPMTYAERYPNGDQRCFACRQHVKALHPETRRCHKCHTTPYRPTPWYRIKGRAH